MSFVIDRRFEVRAVTRLAIHCAVCGNVIVNDIPHTDRAIDAAIATAKYRLCTNPNCEVNGGNEKRQRDE